MIEKIQKLLSMTTENGCTPSEAANAALLAEKLLTQHKLSMSDVLKDSFKNGEVKAVQGTGHVKDNISTAWANGIALGVGKLCYCKTFGVKAGFAFVGFADDVRVASALMDHFMLHAQASMNQFRDKDWKQFKKSKPGVRYNGGKVRGEFLTGYGQAVTMRLRARIAEKEAEAAQAAADAVKAQHEAEKLAANGTQAEATTGATAYEIAVFSHDAIKAWEAEQIASGSRFKTSKATVRVGKATTAGFAAGQKAPLSPQSAIA
jgi:hypothetical protein